MNVEELKEKARRHEQKEEWQKAFDLYSTALRIHDEDESPDITLYNRVGDIQTRLGQINGAVEQYEKAIQLYLEAELPNNAIAICKKVLRNLPDRNVFFLRMGQIRAGQGFLTDARQNFLTYAERQTALGDIESALNALIEFVEISPEDVEIRQGLASQLEAHDRIQEAVEQYREVHRRLALAGEDEEASAVVEKVQALAPDLELQDPDTIRAEEAAGIGFEEEELVVESTSLSGMELEEWGGEEPGFEGVEVDFDTSSEEESSGEAQEEDALTVGDLEFADPGSTDLEPAGAEEVSGTLQEELKKEEEEEDVLPAFEFGDQEDAEVAEVLPGFGFETGQSEEEEVEPGDLPFIGFGEEEDEGLQEEEREVPHLDEDEEDALPLLTFEDEAEPLAEGTPGLDQEEIEAGEADRTPVEAAREDSVFEAGRVGDEEAEVAGDAEPSDAEPGVALEQPLDAEPGIALEQPLDAEPAPGLDGELEVDPTFVETVDHQEAANRGDMDLGMDRVNTLLQEDPDNVELHQRLVEYAFRKNDQEVLVSAYLALAGCLSRTGSPLKAKAVYQQVLSLAPSHEKAAAAIQELEGGGPAQPPTQVASSEEYVDLGSMILGEDAEKTTRWRVAAEAPSGDEEADFAKMLSQFKDKVSEHVAADDVSAHHDLGTAYMEMGLFEEAIGEFQMALRASPTHLPTHEVMGRCWMEMGKPDMAVRALNRALSAPFEVEDELIGIYYLLGRAYEEQGNRGDALEFYEKVFSLDINFEDVTERLRALR